MLTLMNAGNKLQNLVKMSNGDVSGDSSLELKRVARELKYLTECFRKAIDQFSRQYR
jgi:hypothetical protein